MKQSSQIKLFRDCKKTQQKHKRTLIAAQFANLESDLIRLYGKYKTILSNQIKYQLCWLSVLINVTP